MIFGMEKQKMNEIIEQLQEIEKYSPAIYKKLIIALPAFIKGFLDSELEQTKIIHLPGRSARQRGSDGLQQPDSRQQRSCSVR